MPLIDAPRDVVFVHGVQWVRDFELRGYSRPTQDLMQNQAPSVKFRFHEVLWSDVVEEDERKLIAAGQCLADVVSGNYGEAVFVLLRFIGKRMGFSLPAESKTLGTPVATLIKSKGGFIANALSAILDLAFYFSPKYGPVVRQRVRDTLKGLNSGLPPILFGHSLGSVILLDILREDLPGVHAGGFVSAGSPIGLFEPSKDAPEFAKMDWVNFYDTDDIVAFWNPLRRMGYNTVADQRIDTSELPFYSHVKYWTNSFVARELVDRCLTA